MSRICDVGQSGWILPFSPNEEFEKPDYGKGIVYVFVMIYFFMGVAVVADTFVSSIEKITARWKTVRDKDGRLHTKKVWNETIATLSLMALGSSAPEIFLSIMDIIGNGFHFGSLGPATIVGSASFNLLVIIATCIIAIPSNEVRTIDALPSFYITAFFSFIAYVWMVVILSMISKDIVEIWEAVVTLALFPLLLYVSYKVDVGAWDHIFVAMKLCSPRVSVGIASGYMVFSKGDRLTVDAPVSAPTTIDVLVVAKFLGSTGTVEASCTYHTEGMSAIAEVDFEESEGRLEFRTEAPEQHIQLTILPKACGRCTDEFLLILDTNSGLSFNPEDDGGEDLGVLRISITTPADKSIRRRIDKLVNLDAWNKGHSAWKDQALSVLYVNGDKEAQADASVLDWVFHFINLPWSVIYLLIPPPEYAGGWFCFWGALLFIAINSAWLSDLASMFGCVLDFPDIVTAITFVALGTSTPDLFASLHSARDDPSADASIVNVTGSNGVNVFLGCGLPWLLASVYWSSAERTSEWEARYPKSVVAKIPSDSAAFIVDSTNLDFSVFSYLFISLIAVALMVLRRKLVGAELGGPRGPKIWVACSFFLFWLAWVVLVSWRTARYEILTSDAGQTENYLVMFGMLFGFIVLTSCCIASMLRNRDRCSVVEDRNTYCGETTDPCYDDSTTSPASPNQDKATTEDRNTPRRPSVTSSDDQSRSSFRRGSMKDAKRKSNPGRQSQSPRDAATKDETQVSAWEIGKGTVPAIPENAVAVFSPSPRDGQFTDGTTQLNVDAVPDMRNEFDMPALQASPRPSAPPPSNVPILPKIMLTSK